jgi:hypothetical protein
MMLDANKVELHGCWKEGHVPTVWRSRALASVAAVTLVVAVTLPAVILPGRVVAGTTRAGRSAARRTRRAAIAVTARIESP